MRGRVGMAAVLLLAAVAPEALGAKKVCRIVQDARGDASYQGIPGDEADDLLSADLASDGRRLTAVWRLAALRAPNPAAPLGQDLHTYFLAPGTQTRLFVRASTATQPPTFEFGYVAPGTPLPQNRRLGSARGVLDPSRREVRLTLATRGFSPSKAVFPKGGRLRSIDVYSGRRATPAPLDALGVGPYNLTLDEASGRAYVIGTPSCARSVP